MLLAWIARATRTGWPAGSANGGAHETRLVPGQLGDRGAGSLARQVVPGGESYFVSFSARNSTFPWTTRLMIHSTRPAASRYRAIR